MTSTDVIQGSCLCRAVQWEVRAPLFNLSHCHCSQCRKAHAAPFATYVGAKTDGFRYVTGEDAIARYRSSAQLERAFCGRCGSVVPDAPTGKSVYMPAGCLDGELGVQPAAHIFTASKAPWYEIADATPQHAAYPEGWSFPTPEPVAPAQPVDNEPRSDGSATGSCLCGRVAYAIAAGPGLGVYYCHCTRCRKARAAAHNANTFLEPARFSWLRGQDELRSFKVPEAIRYAQVFCGSCGSGMPIARPERAVVPVATIDTPFVPADFRHIFVGSKAPWLTIADGHPQHVEYPS